MSPASEVRSLFTRHCAVNGAPRPGSPERNALIRTLYRELHCRLDDNGDGWSNQRQAFEHLTRAEGTLNLQSVRHTEFTELRTTLTGQRIVRDGEGIEVLVPAAATVHPEPAGPVVLTPALALTQEGRWLRWSYAVGAHPGELFRIYVNALPVQVFTVWAAIVAAADSAGVRGYVKMATSSELGRRADCVTAYAPGSDLAELIAIVRSEVDARWCEPAVAGFARPVSAGIGVGIPVEDESANGSLGWTWATRLVDALIAGPDRLDAQLRTLEAELQTLDPAVPV
jgi:type III HopA1-like effector protein